MSTQTPASVAGTTLTITIQYRRSFAHVTETTTVALPDPVRSHQLAIERARKQLEIPAAQVLAGEVSTA